jgi:hypothetical protein
MAELVVRIAELLVVRASNHEATVTWAQQEKIETALIDIL